MTKHENALEAIKQYLIAEGVKVTDVIRWQGGFTHEGTPHGLEILATVIVSGEEERYCVPKQVITGIPRLKFLKIGDGEVRPRSDEPSNPLGVQTNGANKANHKRVTAFNGMLGQKKIMTV